MRLFVLGQCHCGLRLLARVGDLARANQRVGEREGPGGGIWSQLTHGAERANRFVESTHAYQQFAELKLHGRERRMRTDDRLQGSDPR